MKTKILLTLCLLIGWMSSCYSAGEKKPEDLRILYLAGNSDWNPEARAMLPAGVYEEGLTLRKQAFGDLLRKYFGEVTVMEAADYSPEMSDDYDVTIFDGMPPVLEQKVMERDASGRATRYLRARYLPADFSAPCITIGEVSARIGERIGIKNDWFCLCLDACAHHVATEHPIFQGPFPVKLTFEEQPTPEEAFYYQHQFDEPIPATLPMWRVQTKGYKTETGFGVGLVSHPWGYTDSPDCEYISSGVCAKSPDAVAIGRHGNFLHWGFIASPAYMTEEAKTVFANAVAYIAKFRGPVLVRKLNADVPTRTTVKDLKYMASRASYDDQLRFLNSMKKLQDDTYNQLKAKKEKGETLTAQEAQFFNAYQPMQVSLPPFEAYLKQQVSPELFARFGTDEAAYARYYDENAPYFYGGGGGRDLVIDEDAKAWGIANNDKRLLDKAIACLETGEDSARARRVLERYTLCDFATPAEWRRWYDRHADKLFFTESGGWFFMVDGSRHTPGNDYSVLIERKPRAEETSVPSSSATASSVEPTADDPVVITASATAQGDGLYEVAIRIRLYKGFHIYREVGSADPYIPMTVDFRLPEGCALEGALNMPAARPFGSGGTQVYEGEATLRQLIRSKQSGTVKLTVSYQCCDNNICLPPQEETFEVRL